MLWPHPHSLAFIPRVTILLGLLSAKQTCSSLIRAVTAEEETGCEEEDTTKAKNTQSRAKAGLVENSLPLT